MLGCRAWDLVWQVSGSRCGLQGLLDGRETSVDGGQDGDTSCNRSTVQEGVDH